MVGVLHINIYIPFYSCSNKLTSYRSVENSYNKDEEIYSAGDIGINQSSPHTISGYTGLTINHATHGGFIQFRAEVGIEDNGYEGLKIKTRGNGEEYYLFIRTTKTRLPWLYYGSSFIASEEWKWIEIPFSSFEKSDGRFSRFLPEEFDIETIKSIGVVAYGKDFYANIDVAGIELY